MDHSRLIRALGVLAAVLSVAGCHDHSYPPLFYQEPPPPVTLGTHVDAPFQIQERNAEASKYVIYQHEFRLNQGEIGGAPDSVRLNEDGQDHLRQIAAGLRRGWPHSVIVERSRTSKNARSRYGYRVNHNAQLDNHRRLYVVHALAAMGIENASALVLVAPAYAEGITAREAERAYRRGMYAPHSIRRAPFR